MAGKKKCVVCGKARRSVRVLYCPDCDIYACEICAYHLPPDYDTPRCPNCWLRLRPQRTMASDATQ